MLNAQSQKKARNSLLVRLWKHRMSFHHLKKAAASAAAFWFNS